MVATSLRAICAGSTSLGKLFANACSINDAHACSSFAKKLTLRPSLPEAQSKGSGQPPFQTRDKETVATLDARRHEHVACGTEPRFVFRRYRAPFKIALREKPIHHFRRFARVGRADGIDEHAARKDVTCDLLEQRPLRRGQPFAVALLLLPARLGLTSDDADARTRRVDEHPFKAAPVRQQLLRRVTGNDRAGNAGPLQTFRQNLRFAFVPFDAEQRAVMRETRADL